MINRKSRTNSSAFKRDRAKWYFRGIASVLVALVFLYAGLVNETVTVTAQQKDLEREISETSIRLTEVSAELAAIESLLGSSMFAEFGLSQIEPTKFVHRSVDRGFSYNDR